MQALGAPAVAALQQEQVAEQTTEPPKSAPWGTTAHPGQEATRNGVLRRTVIKAGMVMVGGAIAGPSANVWWATNEERKFEQRLPDNETHLQWVSKYRPGIHKEVMVYFPGTGDIHSVKEAQQLRRTTGLVHTPLAAMVLAHREPYSLEDLVDITYEQLAADPPEAVGYVGKSGGGNIGLMVMAQVADRLGIYLSRFSMWSTPYDLSYGNFGNVASLLDRKTGDHNVINEDAKYNTVFWKSVQQHGWVHTLTHLDDVLTEFEAGEDPNGLRHFVHLLNTFDMEDPAFNAVLKRVMRPGITKGLYVTGKRPGKDETVHDQSSFEAFQASFEKLGVDFTWRRGDFVGHTDVHSSGEVMIPWLKHTGEILLASK